MFHRKDAVSMAVAGLLASCGAAMADTTQVKTPALSLEPTVVTAQDSGAPSTLLMMGLDKVGLAKPVQSVGLNIYGWVEGGYSANLRNNQGTDQDFSNLRRPIGFTANAGNHFNFNQLAIRVEKLVDSKKWDVGGLVELNFGTDANATTPALSRIGDFSSGWELTHIGDNAGENPQLDVPQAYVDVNIPVGNGLKVRAGRFYTIFGYESFDPRGNPFYSHSYIFGNEPLENTGVLAFYNINEQFAVAGGISRGWNQNTEDDNGGIDALGQITFTPNKQWQAILNWEVGPQDPSDNSHYDVSLNPILVWQATEKLKLGAEGFYEYDGGFNGFAPSGVSHAYGDNYGVALYGQYAINEYFTANVRGEWMHTYGGVPFPITGAGIPSSNAWEITAGVSIHPLPKDPIGQNLVIRPELRYDFSEDHDYVSGSRAFRDMWTASADVIFTF